MLTEGCLTCQIPQLHNGAMLAVSQHNGGWVGGGEGRGGGGAQERLVTPGEGRTLSTLAGDDRRMNARFEEAPAEARLRVSLVPNLQPGAQDGCRRVPKTHIHSQ